jgi:hypothetical protein
LAGLETLKPEADNGALGARAALAPPAERVLLLSMREIAALVGYCALYEFEDVVAELTGAEIATPVGADGLELSRKVYKVARHLSGSQRFAESIRPRLGTLRMHQNYDLFVACFNHPHELFALKAIPDWRRRCRVAVCYICEAWTHLLPPYLLELLKDFDQVFLGVSGPTQAVSDICGRPCSYLPMGVDAIRFCPHPDLPDRAIDVCGIGRRSPVTHATLLDRAREGGFFYYYDTVESKAFGRFGRQLTFRVGNVQEHRLLLASLLKRSRYFIANRAWADDSELTRGKDEIASRFYEGAAAGAVMLGDPPDTEDFRAQFDWDGAVVAMPFHASEVARVIAGLEKEPERVAGIRRRNVVNALSRHDWSHRLRALLEAAGLSPTPRMVGREARLSALAEELRGAAREPERSAGPLGQAVGGEGVPAPKIRP